MNQNLYDLMEDNPVIAAVSDMEGLKTCCGIEEIKVVFILFGDMKNFNPPYQITGQFFASSIQK